MIKENRWLQFKSNFLYTYTYIKISPMTKKEHFFFIFGAIFFFINICFQQAYPLINAVGSSLMVIGGFFLGKRAIFQEIIPQTRTYYREYYLPELKRLHLRNQSRAIFTGSAFAALFAKATPSTIKAVCSTCMSAYITIESVYYFNFNYTISVEIWRAKVGIQSYEDAWRHITTPGKYLNSTETPRVQDLLEDVTVRDQKLIEKDQMIKEKEQEIENLRKFIISNLKKS
jgi:hypothetical protein